MWTPPSLNADGSAYTNGSGFKVYYGSTPSNLSSVVSVSGPTTTSVVVNGLTSGTYYFSVATINSGGTESTKSSPASVVVP